MRSLGLDDDGIALHLRHSAHQDTPVTWRTSRHDFLVIGATKEVRTKPSRVNLRKLQLVLFGSAEWQAGPCFVYGLSVSARRQGNIVFVFIAPFDLERRDAEFD